MKDLFLSKRLSYVLGGLMLASATIIPSISHATTYYVSTTGSDANTGFEKSPFRSIKQGISNLSAGDTLYVKSGTYTESILSWQTPIPNGKSWDDPITIATYPGHEVTIKPPSGHAFFWIKDGKAKYLIIDGFMIDGQNSASHGFKFTLNTRYIRIQNSEIKNSKATGIIVTICDSCDPATFPHDTYHEFKNLHVHHNGTTDKDHGFYIETSYNLVESCDVHHNSGNGGKFFSAHKSPNGVTARTSNYNIARFNILHDNSQWNPEGWTFGWLLSSGVENKAYGNIAYNNSIGFAIGNGATRALLYDNLSYDNRLYGINVYGVWGGSTGGKVFNNTLYNNAQFGIGIRDGAKDTVVRNNISYNNGIDESRNIWLEPNESPGTVLSHNLVTDPKFVDSASKDFKLKISSPAIDKGMTILEVPIDFYGNSRPQGSAFDIGAHELVLESDEDPPQIPKKVTIF